MFKQIMGFDTDKLSFGVAVKIDDTEPLEKPRGIFFTDLDGLEHKWNNKSGNYLIRESSSTILRLTNVFGEEVKFHIRHFTGFQPRMSIKIIGENSQ